MEHRRPDEGAVTGWAFAGFCKPFPLFEYKIAMSAAGRLNNEPPVVLLNRLFDVLQVVIDIFLGDPRIDRYLTRREGLFLEEGCNKMTDRLIPFNRRLGFSQSLFHVFSAMSYLNLSVTFVIPSD